MANASPRPQDPSPANRAGGIVDAAAGADLFVATGSGGNGTGPVIAPSAATTVGGRDRAAFPLPA